jgi:hypothetical protein
MIQPDEIKLNQPLVIRSPFVSKAIPVKELNTDKKPPVCYQTDERYFCKKNCNWKSGCKALTAAWLRRN